MISVLLSDLSLAVVGIPNYPMPWLGSSHGLGSNDDGGSSCDIVSGVGGRIGGHSQPTHFTSSLT